jgi:hypothetical protein
MFKSYHPDIAFSRHGHEFKSHKRHTANGIEFKFISLMTKIDDKNFYAFY